MIIFISNNFMQEISINRIKEIWNHAGFQKYFRNMGWSFASKFFSLIISFLIGTLVARYLGPQRYGVMSYAVSFVGIFSFLSSFGIDNILVRELLKNKNEKENILNTSFLLKAIGGVLIILLSVSISTLLKNDLYTTILIFIYSTTLFFSSANVIDFYFQSTLKYKYSFLSQTISTIIVSIIKLFLIYKNLGTGWFILTFVLESAITSLILIKIFKKNGHSLKLNFDFNKAKEMIGNSWPFIFATAFYLIYTKIDQIMIGNMLDTTSLGIYSAGVKIAEIWYFVPGIICGVLFPAIVNARITDSTTYKKRIKKLFITIFILSFVIALFEFIFAKILVLILFGNAYYESIIILKIYAWAGIIISTIIVLQQYLTIENKTKIIMVSFFIGAVSNIILNLILIPSFSIAGAAWATIISYSIIPIYSFIKINRKTNILLK